MNIALENYLRKNISFKFDSVPIYCKEDDSVLIYFDNIASYAEKIDSHLDIYRSFSDESIIVGLKVKNIKSIMNEFQIIGDEKIKLSLILKKLLIPKFFTNVYFDIYDLIEIKELEEKEFSIKD